MVNALTAVVGGPSGGRWGGEGGFKVSEVCGSVFYMKHGSTQIFSWM